jgi:hypothetical protein
MPLPTKVWADNASYSTQPPDAFLDDGLHPKKPWLTEYVNWTLNFIWGTLVGAEHDEFTGAHTDVTYDTITANSVLGAATTLPGQFTLRSSFVGFCFLGLSDWGFATNNPLTARTLLGLPAAGPEVMLLEAGVDAFVDLNTHIPPMHAGDATISAVVLYLGSGTKDDVDWFLEKRAVTGAASWTLVDSGSVATADVGASAGGNAVTIVSASHVPTSTEIWRLRLRGTTLEADMAADARAVYSAAVLFGTTQNYPA